MCGIYLCVGAACSKEEHSVDIVKTELFNRLSHRGPDIHNTQTFHISPNTSDNRHDTSLYVTCRGDTLCLRGAPTGQPLIHQDSGDVLMFNGQVYDSVNRDILDIKKEDNDTQVILDTLQRYSPQEVFPILRGPFAFVYWHRASGTVFYGRDFLGRRSLMLHVPHAPSTDHGDPEEPRCRTLMLCSISLNCNPAKTLNLPVRDKRDAKAVGDADSDSDSASDQLCNDCHWEDVGTDGIYSIVLDNLGMSSCLTGYISHRKGEEGSSPGGVDSLSRLVTLYPWGDKTALPAVDPSTPSPPSDTTRHSIGSTLPRPVPHLNTACPSDDILEQLYQPEQEALFEQAVTQFGKLLTQALVRRIASIPPSLAPRAVPTPDIPSGYTVTRPADNTGDGQVSSAPTPPPSSSSSSALSSSTSSSGAAELIRAGILFSGGVDSMVLAATLHQVLPAQEVIELINVAFGDKAHSVPDRKTGIAGYHELCNLYPDREWRLVLVDVSLEELNRAKKYILQLIYPAHTVMDLSIGCAFWYAARGQGYLYQPVNKSRAGITPTTSTSITATATATVAAIVYHAQCRVLIAGQGIDEQLAGYARHRTRFRNVGWDGLVNELELEMKRLWKRNLGRDDRCIADHGCELRCPYLDLDVVAFCNTLPLWIKADLRQERGVGEKRLIRRYAQRLGFDQSTSLPKRAIQFGSRIAKLDNYKEKGGDVINKGEVLMNAQARARQREERERLRAARRAKQELAKSNKDAKAQAKREWRWKQRGFDTPWTPDGDSDPAAATITSLDNDSTNASDNTATGNGNHDDSKCQ